MVDSISYLRFCLFERISVTFIVSDQCSKRFAIERIIVRTKLDHYNKAVLDIISTTSASAYPFCHQEACLVT
jgi:hypothetical protein